MPILAIPPGFGKMIPHLHSLLEIGTVEEIELQPFALLTKLFTVCGASGQKFNRIVRFLVADRVYCFDRSCNTGSLLILRSYLGGWNQRPRGACQSQERPAGCLVRIRGKRVHFGCAFSVSLASAL
jgi:hypothetical protein